ncbi:MAG: hypothetical protein DMF65_11250 [Acidobacteria bacterium]|nr:MAG: hypothetical protein DMF65_11250 [Acidobacteriota bacterium]
MKLSRLMPLACALIFAAALAGCSSDMNKNAGENAATPAASPGASPAEQTLTEVERPPKVKEMQAARGEQEDAKPSLKIVEPKEGATVSGSTVKLKLDLGGELKGYKPGKDPATMVGNDPSTMKGNHIHVILDNQPYEAYYNLDQPFELRNVTEGPHTIRVFPSRPWHESYKNDGAFQMVTFTVKGGGDASKPTTASTGEKMADNVNKSVAPVKPKSMNSNMPAADSTPAPTPEGKDYAQQSSAGSVDKTKPLLTYSRPKGEYKGDDTNAIMIDFWLLNARLKDGGGDYRVRYTVDGGEAKYIDKWEPIWLTGWTAGKHTVKLELVDRDGNPVENGGYNTTTREITITK